MNHPTRSPAWYIPGILMGVAVLWLVLMTGDLNPPLARCMVAGALAVIFGSATKISFLVGGHALVNALLWFCWVGTGLTAVFYLYQFLEIAPYVR